MVVPGTVPGSNLSLKITLFSGWASMSCVRIYIYNIYIYIYVYRSGVFPFEVPDLGQNYLAEIPPTKKSAGHRDRASPHVSPH